MINISAIQVVSPVSVKRTINKYDVTLKDGKIILSQELFNKVDLQNNKLYVYYEQGDNEVHFLFHNSDTLYADFFKGKLGKDGLIGKKTLSANDKKNNQDKTVRELISAKFPELDGNLPVSFYLVEDPTADGSEKEYGITNNLIVVLDKDLVSLPKETGEITEIPQVLTTETVEVTEAQPYVKTASFTELVTNFDNN
jgi:hypothetical protein